MGTLHGGVNQSVELQPDYQCDFSSCWNLGKPAAWWDPAGTRNDSGFRQAFMDPDVPMPIPQSDPTAPAFQATRAAQNIAGRKVADALGVSMTNPNSNLWIWLMIGGAVLAGFLLLAGKKKKKGGKKA